MPDYQNDVAGSLVNCAQLLKARKDLRGALQLFQQALPYHQAALKVHPRHPQYRAYFRNNRQVLSEVQVMLTLHAEAAATAEELVQAAVQPSHDYYNAACTLSRCVPLAAKDAKLAEEKRKDLSLHYAERAMEILRQAVANGWKDAAHMKKDTDLDSLRQREDFKQLLAELEKGKAAK